MTRKKRETLEEKFDAYHNRKILEFLAGKKLASVIKKNAEESFIYNDKKVQDEIKVGLDYLGSEGNSMYEIDRMGGGFRSNLKEIRKKIKDLEEGGLIGVKKDMSKKYPKRAWITKEGCWMLFTLYSMRFRMSANKEKKANEKIRLKDKINEDAREQLNNWKE